VIRTSVAVIGDGPAGTAAALALLARGLEVTLIGGRSRVRVGEHLPPRAWPALEALGLRHAAESAALVCHGVESAWGDERAARRDYLFSPWRVGLNLDRAAFDQALRAEVVDRGGRVLASRPARELHRLGSTWQVRLADGTKLEASFLVDASGRAAWVGRRAGARLVAVDHLVGWWVRLRPSDPPNDASLHVGAAPDGWWYAAPLADGTVAAAWMTDPDLLPPRRRSGEGWVRHFASSSQLSFPVEDAQLVALQVVPARSQLLEPSAGPGWLAVGDAATALDPLSSSGIAKALDDALTAADIIRMQVFCSNPAAGGVWVARVRRAFGSFLGERYAYYALERRWADRPFWQRRGVRGVWPTGAVTLPVTLGRPAPAVATMAVHRSPPSPGALGPPQADHSTGRRDSDFAEIAPRRHPR
jgi:flavin-dependent dehydrogenase